MFGPVKVVERVWRTPEKSCNRPFSRRAGVRARGLSRRLRRVLADFGADESFAGAEGKVKEHYGLEIGASTVRRCTLGSAAEATALLEKEYARSYRALPSKGVACVIAQMDGSFLRVVDAGSRSGKRPRQWREARLAAARAQGAAAAVYAATFGDVQDAGRRWGHCAKAAGRGLRTRVHPVADGAEWIRLQSREIFGPDTPFLCDFYHVGQYLAAAAPACRPHAPERWRHVQGRRLKRGALKPVLAELAARQESSALPDDEAPVRAARRYLANRRDCLDYPAALAAGLPVGSGLIESGHRHLLQRRLKLPGAAWLQTTAQDIAQLRVLRANDRWDELWN